MVVSNTNRLEWGGLKKPGWGNVPNLTKEKGISRNKKFLSKKNKSQGSGIILGA